MRTLTQMICKCERFLSDITRINWLRCANCKFYEFEEEKQDVKCEATGRYPLEWQYCCNFRKRQKQNKTTELLKKRLELKSVVRHETKLLNLIQTKKRELENLKEYAEDEHLKAESLRKELCLEE